MDEIVAAVNWEDRVYVFTRDGYIYEMFKDSHGIVSFQKLVGLFKR